MKSAIVASVIAFLSLTGAAPLSTRQASAITIDFETNRNILTGARGLDVDNTFSTNIRAIGVRVRGAPVGTVCEAFFQSTSFGKFTTQLRLDSFVLISQIRCDVAVAGNTNAARPANNAARPVSNAARPANNAVRPATNAATNVEFDESPGPQPAANIRPVSNAAAQQAAADLALARTKFPNAVAAPPGTQKFCNGDPEAASGSGIICDGVFV